MDDEEGFKELEGATLSLVDCGVDYYRVTAHHGWLYETFGEQMRKIPAKAFTDDYEAPGELPWRFLQYSGFRRGRVACGISEQGSVAQESGKPLLFEFAKGLEWINVTRIDLQATYVPDGIDASHYIRCVAGLMAKKKASGTFGKMKLTHIEGNGDGNTLYIGSRQSEAFLRIYDKGRQSAGDGTIRFEVELKAELAKKVWMAYQASELLGEVAARLVLGRLSAYMPLHTWRLQGEVGHLRATRRKTASDIETYQWLRRSVRPACERLQASGFTQSDLISAIFGDFTE